MKSSYKHMTPEDYKLIKFLKDKGTKTGLIIKISGRSQGTIYQVGVSKDYDDYKRIIRESLEKSKSKRLALIEQPEVNQKDQILARLDNIESELLLIHRLVTDIIPF